MARKSSHITTKRLMVTPKKVSRVTRFLLHNGSGEIVVSRLVGSKKRTIRFKAISEKQQMKERNSAYQFFSID